MKITPEHILAYVPEPQLWTFLILGPLDFRVLDFLKVELSDLYRGLAHRQDLVNQADRFEVGIHFVLPGGTRTKTAKHGKDEPVDSKDGKKEFDPRRYSSPGDSLFATSAMLSPGCGSVVQFERAFEREEISVDGSESRPFAHHFLRKREEEVGAVDGPTRK